MKLYLQEDGREVVFAAVNASEQVATSTIAYAEARSTFARKWRENRWDAEGHKQAVSDLNEDWPSYLRLIVSHELAYSAGALAERYALRGYDSVHLESVIQLAEWEDDVPFLAFDEDLIASARRAQVAIYGGLG